MSSKVDGKFRMALEFERLNDVTTSLKNEHLDVALKTENKNRNRNESILPREYF